MRNYSAKDVNEYIASSPGEAQAKLKELRAVVKAAVPEAQEGISWGVPFYKYHGLLAGFAALKNHVDFGLVFALQDSDRKTLENQGYLTGKKTVQIKFDQRIPTTEITQILSTQAKLNKAKI